MRAHRLAVLGLLAAATVTAAGCGSSDTDTAATTAAATAPATTTAAQKTVPHIAVIVAAFADYQQAQEKGVENVVKPLGGDHKLFNANYDPQKLQAQCTDAITSGRFNAILLQVLDPPTGVPCVAAAKKAGIPVVALNTAIGTDPNDLEPQVDGVVGGIYSTPAENVKSNQELVKMACEGIDPCRVIVELATPTDPMTNSVADALAQTPGVEVVAKFATNFDPGQVAQKMPDILSAHPDANVFASIADADALAAIPALKAAGLEGKVKLIGDGAATYGAQAIKDGTLFASTANYPIQEGEITAGMAVKALNGEPIDPKGIDQDFIDEPRLVTKENVDQLKPEWGAAS